MTHATADIPQQNARVPSTGVDSAAAPIRVSTEVTAAEWDAYVHAHPDATPDHLWHWREIFDGVFGHRCRYLVAHRGDRIVGILPLVLVHSRLFGRFVASVPFLNYGGLLVDDHAVARGLMAEVATVAQKFGASHVELRHLRRHFEDLPVREHKLAITRPLPATSDELWSTIDRKVRNQVRKAQKEGLVATQGGAELVDDFYRVFAENMRDLGTPVYGRALFARTLDVFGDRARIFLVRQGDRVMAGSVAIRFRDTVLVPWASSLREFRHLCPNMLLYWAMMEAAVQTGARVFDFGRSSPGAGTHQFKVQWGGEPTPMQWEYLLLTRAEAPDQGPANPKFDLAIRAWRRLPLSVATWLGPRIARHLP